MAKGHGRGGKHDKGKSDDKPMDGPNPDHQPTGAHNPTGTPNPDNKQKMKDGSDGGEKKGKHGKGNHDRMGN